jgi:ribose transport system ATP-binding protein
MMATASELELQAIEKSFGGVKALKSVSFSCLAGEVHCLLGENGAGKSTLMRIIAGVSRPDAGRILVRGQEVELTSPRAAQDLGIAMVYQDTRLVPDLDVSQNIWLGREPGGILVDRHRMDDEAAKILARLDTALPLRSPISDLTVAERQVVEIARALTINPSLLILDEPTSAIDTAEIERLFAIVRTLTAAGTAVVFISHRLPEVFAISDRITVLKDGEVVGTVLRDETDADALVRMMVGRDMALAYPPRAQNIGPVRLETNSISSGGRFQDVTLSVSAGEILGLGGIQGNGQAAVARALFGLVPYDGAVMLDGKLADFSPAQAIAAGLVYIPGDRHREGLFMPHSIRENLSLPHLTSLVRGGLLSSQAENRLSADAIRRFAVKTPSPEAEIATLSGGNQQKVVLGRWTTGSPRVYIFEDPTRGVDVATKLQIYREIRGLAEHGAAVILVASDLMELIGLSDRILILSQGRIVDEVPGAEATEERIVGSATDAGRVAAGRASVETIRSGAVVQRLPDNPLLRRYGSSLLLTLLTIVLAAVTAMSSEYFLTSGNAINLAVQITPLALVALGQLAVILLGGVDLSVGPMVSLVTAIVSFLAVQDTGMAITTAVAVSLAAGLAGGLFNGMLVLWLRIPDLIATLASYSIVFGLALTLRPSPGGLVSDAYLDFFEASVASVPIAALVAVALAIAFEILLLRGRLGQRLYATGSSAEGARVSGIRTNMVRISAYAFCGIMAAGAGLLIAARIGSGDAQSGMAFTLGSITAVVVGGASVFGGRGTAIGTLLGAIVVGLMQNALNLMQVSAYYQYIWAGALTLIAVSAHALQRARR